jgi:hypothetical protein
MREEDRNTILAMIDKMKAVALDPAAVERASTDLATAFMMASDPELEMAENRPVILTQGQRVYRAYPINA